MKPAKPLRTPNDPTYLRRLARELSGQVAGFYHGGERWKRATYSKGQLNIFRTVDFRKSGTPIETSASFSAVSQDTGPFFDDVNGRTIFASRQV